MLHCSCTHASPVIGHVADAASSSQHTSAGMFILMTSCISITHTFVFTQSHSWLCSSSNWKREEKREKRDHRDLNFWLVVQRAVVLETANNNRPPAELTEVGYFADISRTTASSQKHPNVYRCFSKVCLKKGAPWQYWKTNIGDVSGYSCSAWQSAAAATSPGTPGPSPQKPAKTKTFFQTRTVF